MQMLLSGRLRPRIHARFTRTLLSITGNEAGKALVAAGPQL